MYKITSHQTANLYWPGPSRIQPQRGEFTLLMGQHLYPSIPPHLAGRFETFECDGLIEIELVDDQAVAS